jgi:hypothetical protein
MLVSMPILTFFLSNRITDTVADADADANDELQNIR